MRQSLFFVFTIALMGVLIALSVPARETTITLDANTRYQTIDSWPVYLRYWEDDKINNRYDNSFAPHTKRVSRFLADEVGINGARVEIWSGLENPVDHWSRWFNGELTYKQYKQVRYQKVNDNDSHDSENQSGFQFARFDYMVEQMLMPLKHAVEANGEKLHINVNFVDFKMGDQGSFSHADNPEEFAEFVLVFFKRLRDKYGIIPGSFEAILEPDLTVGWRGQQIGRGLVAVKQRLNANGFYPEFIAPSVSKQRNGKEYIEDMMNVSGVPALIDTISYHRYGGTQADIREIARLAQNYDKKTAMLEKLDGGIDILIEDLTVANVSGWQQWAIAGLASWGEGCGFYVQVETPEADNPGIKMAKCTPQLSNVFKYVRTGAQRIGTTSDNGNVKSVGFINKDGMWAVVVRMKDTLGAVNIVGLPSGCYGLRFTDNNNKMEEWSPVSISQGQTLTTHLPHRGVLTVYSIK